MPCKCNVNDNNDRVSASDMASYNTEVTPQTAKHTQHTSMYQVYDRGISHETIGTTRMRVGRVWRVYHALHHVLHDASHVIYAIDISRSECM